MADFLKPLGVVPAAFAAIGAKVNELVAAVNGAMKWRSIQASSPLELVQSEQNAVIRIDVAKLQAALGNTKGTGTGGGGSSSGSATELHNTAAQTIDIDANGLSIRMGNAELLVNAAGYFQFYGSASRSNNCIVFNEDGMTLYGGSAGKFIDLPYGSVDRAMGIVTYAVCNNGTPATADFISSQPY